MTTLRRPLLFYMDISPPCRMVKMVIDKLNIDVDIKIVDMYKMEQKSQPILELNPMGLIPILKHGDLVINDSHAIASYLVDTFHKGHSLYPENTSSRAKVNQMMAFNMTTLFPRTRFLIKELMEEKKSKPSEKALQSLKEAYGFLDIFLEKSKRLAGNELTLADYCCLTTLTTGEIFSKVSSEHPHLLKWLEECKAMPDFLESNSVGLENLRRLVNTIRSSLDK